MAVVVVVEESRVDLLQGAKKEGYTSRGEPMGDGVEDHDDFVGKVRARIRL